ncbi:RNA polymerase sigma factor [Rhodohalobacter sp. SW132]|nr:RNA polymerase sigma factor [Rhodohalobacter sp. SW132]
MSITLRYADSREQGVEILNDAFMKVFENIKSYDQSRPFKPWLRRIIINTAINHYHKYKKGAVHDSFELHENSIGQKEAITCSLSYQEIIEMVQQLSPAYRTVFNLYVIEGFSHREIANMLDIAEGTSKSNLSKAKKNLQEIVKKNLSYNRKQNG